MSTSHTPGPWTAIERFGAVKSEGCTVAMADNHYVPSPGHGFPSSREERNANARLIAAAPELLSLLKRLMDSRTKHFINNEFYGMEGWDEQAREAIRKATTP